MKNKDSRRIIGTFSEVSNLIKSFPQVIYDCIVNPEDEYWQFFLKIREFLRFMLMPKVSESQLVEMDNALDRLMNDRMRLTRINVSEKGFVKKEYISLIFLSIKG